MTSKERAKTAINRQEPDKVPIGEFAIDFDTTERILCHETYHRHKARSQIGFWEGRRDEVVDSWKKDAVELVKKLDLDIAVAWLVPAKDAIFEKPQKIDGTTYEFSDGKILKYSELTVDFTIVHDPNIDRLPPIEDFHLDQDIEPYPESCFEMLDYVIEELGTEKYILFRWGEEQATLVLFNGLEQGLLTMVTQSELVKQAIRFKTKQGNVRDQQLRKYTIDGIMFDMDFASNSGPLFSPQMFRSFCFTSAKERCLSIQNLGFQVIRHACGNNWDLLDMFIESGTECYQSIQPSAGMDLKKVKENYGNRLALWGGVAVEHLVSGSISDVVNDVDYAFKHAASDGGFILGASHSIAVGTKFENYMAMLERFHSLRG